MDTIIVSERHHYNKNIGKIYYPGGLSLLVASWCIWQMEIASFKGLSGVLR